MTTLLNLALLGIKGAFVFFIGFIFIISLGVSLVLFIALIGLLFQYISEAFEQRSK